METQKYDLEYFIKKFEAIPEERWCVARLLDDSGRSCAFGHCGLRNDTDKFNDETQALINLTGGSYQLATVNNGEPQCLRYGSTPRTRVINFLKELKAKKEADELSSSLSVSDKGELKERNPQLNELFKDMVSDLSGGVK